MLPQSLIRRTYAALVALLLALGAAALAVGAAPPVPTSTYLPLMERGLPVRDYLTLATSSVVGNSEIYTLRGDGSELRRLTNSAAADEQPRWSPDGSQILWVRYEGVFPNALYDDLWLMNSDGSNARRLTNHEGLERGSWSPDGTRIFYYNRLNEGDLYSAFTLYITTPDGAPTRIKSHTYVTDYRWAPDSSRLWLLLARRGAMSTENDLYTVNADGSGLTLIAEDIRRAVWSPNSDWIAFDATRNGDENVFLARPDGSDVAAVTNSAMHDRVAAWVEGGARLLLKRTASDWAAASYYLAMPNGSQMTLYIDGGSADDYLDIEGVAPDGNSVVYSATTNQGYVNVYYKSTLNGDALPISPPDCPVVCDVESVGWSARGDAIVYTLYIAVPPRSVLRSVYVVRLDSDPPEFRLLRDRARNPVWLPVGEHLTLDAAILDPAIEVPHIGSLDSGGLAAIPFLNGADFTAIEWRYQP